MTIINSLPKEDLYLYSTSSARATQVEEDSEKFRIYITDIGKIPDGELLPFCMQVLKNLGKNLTGILLEPVPGVGTQEGGADGKIHWVVLKKKLREN